MRLYDNAPGTLLPIPSFPTEYPIAIDSVVYGDSRVSDWPMAADGEGYSLELEHLSLAERRRVGQSLVHALRDVALLLDALITRLLLWLQLDLTT